MVAAVVVAAFFDDPQPAAATARTSTSSECERFLHGTLRGFRLWDENRDGFYFAHSRRRRPSGARRPAGRVARGRRAALGRARAGRVARDGARPRGRHRSARPPRAARDARACGRHARDRVPRPRPLGRRARGRLAGGAAAAAPRARRRGDSSRAAQARLRAKLSYTNIGFALAPATFTISELRQVYVAALGHDVAATNLQRVLLRRGVLERVEGLRPPGRSGGRPAALFRFASQRLRSTDAFATLRPPTPLDVCQDLAPAAEEDLVRARLEARASRRAAPLRYAWAIDGTHTVSRSPHQSVTGARTSASSKPHGRPRYASSRASQRPPLRNDSTRPRAYASSVDRVAGRRRRPSPPPLEPARREPRRDAREPHRARTSRASTETPDARRHRADERDTRDSLGRDRGERERMRAARRPADHAEPLDGSIAAERRLRPRAQRAVPRRPARSGRRASRRTPSDAAIESSGWRESRESPPPCRYTTGAPVGSPTSSISGDDQRRAHAERAMVSRPSTRTSIAPARASASARRGARRSTTRVPAMCRAPIALYAQVVRVLAEVRELDHRAARACTRGRESEYEYSCATTWSRAGAEPAACARRWRRTRASAATSSASFT